MLGLFFLGRRGRVFGRLIGHTFGLLFRLDLLCAAGLLLALGLVGVFGLLLARLLLARLLLGCLLLAAGLLHLFFFGQLEVHHGDDAGLDHHVFDDRALVFVGLVIGRLGLLPE